MGIRCVWGIAKLSIPARQCAGLINPYQVVAGLVVMVSLAIIMSP